MIDIVGGPLAVIQFIGEGADQSEQAFVDIYLGENLETGNSQQPTRRITELIVSYYIIAHKVIKEGHFHAPDIYEKVNLDISELHGDVLPAACECVGQHSPNNVLVQVVQGQFVVQTDIQIEADNDTPVIISGKGGGGPPEGLDGRVFSFDGCWFIGTELCLVQGHTCGFVVPLSKNIPFFNPRST